MLDELSMIYETSQNNPNDAMSRIVEEYGRKKKLNIKSWMW